MNDDLLANPFDEVFKRMIQAFTVLLRAIVETIDQHGLRKRYLQRHKGAVDRFYDYVRGEKFQSEAAQKYQTRFKKNS